MKSSCVCLHICTTSTAPVSSSSHPRRAWSRRSIQGIYSVKVQSGLRFSPKSFQSSLLFPGQAFGEAGQSPQVQPGEDESLSLAELSSSCVALRLSACGFPRGRSCSYTLNNTGTVLIHRDEYLKWDIWQFVLQIPQTCLCSLKCEAQRTPAALAECFL